MSLASLSSTPGYSPPIEINVGTEIRAMTSSANGEHLICGDGGRTRVWRLEDSNEMAVMKTAHVKCLAVSKDGRWIAVGTNDGAATIWDATTYQTVSVHKKDSHGITAVDFSPDSARLLVASKNGTATIWELVHGKQVQTFPHPLAVITAKYAPQGDRVATATDEGVRVLDSFNGRLLVDIKVQVTPLLNNGLLWFHNHLFIVSDGKIQQFDASTGSTVSQWPVLDTDHFSCISLPSQVGFFIACSTNQTVTLFDTSTRSQLSVIQHPQRIRSMALSPDGEFLAVCGFHGKITVESVSRFNASTLRQGRKDKTLVDRYRNGLEWVLGLRQRLHDKLQHQKSDSVLQQQRDQHISLSSAQATIREIVQRTVHCLPRVLINTTTGRLYDRAKLASTFESHLIFNDLASSMTTRIDRARIKREVQLYFRYVMLSHKWEDNEPLYEKMIHTSVYDLKKSSTHDKLQKFCRIARDAGFNWAWSDTCCINRADHFVLQEALVAMFKWYQGSTLVIVFLRGVRSSSRRGALIRSTWNTRAWTLQEYIAAKVVRFYTEDWTLYLALRSPNHKESWDIISEMEEATGVSSKQLMALQPGLTSIREKLRLASTRQTTLVEDAAYSLLGIFSVAGLSAIYGEGDASLGRLLSHVLAGSGDLSILAWTGESGSFNSCLPAYITVFNGPATSHLPLPVSDAEMERITTTSHSSFDLAVALMLFDRLSELPTVWFASNRMRLPCIAFQLPTFSRYRRRSSIVYRADTTAFGTLEIKTRDDLSRMHSLYLVHPWLDTVLEREGIHSGATMKNDVAVPPSPHADNEETPDEDAFDDVVLSPGLPPPHALSHAKTPLDRETRARRLVAHLRQPFGALLVTLAPSQRAVDYQRVAADSVITVRIRDHVALTDILDSVRVLDVL